MKILVWDIPTRLFHWLFAGAFATAWLTSDSDSWLNVHVFAGYLMLGLLAFRLVWGFAGGRYARFASFRFSLKDGAAYLMQVLAGTARRHIGHNPAGSWAVYLLLALGLMAGLSGMITLGGQEGQGPLASWVPFWAGEAFEEVHEALASLMLGVVALHLGGVALESWRHRENLPRAMVTGLKEGPSDAATPSRRWLIALLLLLAVGAGAAGYFSSAPITGGDEDAGHKISRSIDPRETPLRVTETPYWLGKHDEIDAAVWKRPQVGSSANCVACHENAERSVFVPARLPRASPDLIG